MYIHYTVYTIWYNLYSVAVAWSRISIIYTFPPQYFKFDPHYSLAIL